MSGPPRSAANARGTSWTSPTRPTAAAEWVRANTWTNTATRVIWEPDSETRSPSQRSRKSRWRSGVRSTARRRNRRPTRNPDLSTRLFRARLPMLAGGQRIDAEETQMAVRLGDEAPNFTAESTEGTINLYDYLGDGWGVLFSHPKD